MGGGPRLVESRGPSLPSPEARDEGQPGRVPTKGFPIGTRSDGVPKPASWGAPGLPVRARSHSRPGAEAPLPRGSGEIRLELGIGSVPEVVRGRKAVVLGRRPSSDLESSEAAGVASYPRCKRATGVGSLEEHELTKGGPRPCPTEYRLRRLSAARSTSCSRPTPTATCWG